MSYLIILESVGSYFNYETKTLYPVTEHGTADLHCPTPIEEEDIEWFGHLDQTDENILKEFGVDIPNPSNY